MTSESISLNGRSPLAKLQRSLRKRYANVWAFFGDRRLVRGDTAGAVRCCRKAIAISDQCNRAYRSLAQAAMPGETYREILVRIHRYLAPESYLEIGVQTGASLTFAAPGTRSVGIDPHPRITHPISSRAKLFPMTSDAFFERFDLLAELETDRLALAFIDGLHHFEQVLRDFRHIERYADSDTVVLIHDCYPISAPAATRECRTSFWCGDVWKVVPCLRSLRPDLNLGIIPSYPSGLALITGVDRGSSDASLTDDRQLDAFRNMDFDDMACERESWPEVVANDWPSIEALLPTGSQRPIDGHRSAKDPS